MRSTILVSKFFLEPPRISVHFSTERHALVFLTSSFLQGDRYPLDSIQTVPAADPGCLSVTSEHSTYFPYVSCRFVLRNLLAGLLPIRCARNQFGRFRCTDITLPRFPVSPGFICFERETPRTLLPVTASFGTYKRIALLKIKLQTAVERTHQNVSLFCFSCPKIDFWRVIDISELFSIHSERVYSTSPAILDARCY